MENYDLTITEVSKLLEKGELSSVDLTQSVLNRINSVDDRVKAFIKVLPDEALESAKKSDERRAQGKSLGRLDGVVMSIKDLLCTKGVETTAASNILKGFVPCYDATVVKKLKEAGVVIIGKTNLDAFAHGSSTENSDFFTTRNPWDLDRVPGGSSGGSAASVASGECLGSIGTDTGGSIRQPASLCSVVGLKPTYGRVSRYGVISMASSLDVVGPIAKSVEDAALILETIAGKDPLDATTLDAEVPKYFENLAKSIKGIKIGVPKEYFASGMETDVEDIVKKSIETIKSLGGEIIEISLPHTDYALSTYYILQPAEVSSNLSRYDGVKYGYSALNDDKNLSLDDVYTHSRGTGFGSEAKRRIMLGTYVLSAGYYDAYYKKALQLRTLVKQDFEDAFEDVDVILTPVSPTPAFKVGEKADDPVQMYLSDIYTVPINPAGVPAISVPAGFVTRDNKDLPVGIQLIGPMLREQKILDVANVFEKEVKISQRKPEL
jgi:aspartyl-tRNA(Asn)/glutamyl-tRNA(Gln) amidotransferase subunit A